MCPRSISLEIQSHFEMLRSIANHHAEKVHLEFVSVCNDLQGE